MSFPINGSMLGNAVLGRLGQVDSISREQDSSSRNVGRSGGSPVRAMAFEETTMERLAGVRARLDENGYYEGVVSRAAEMDATSDADVEGESDGGVTVTLVDDGIRPGSGGSIQINPFVSIDPDHEPSLIHVTITPEGGDWGEVATDTLIGAGGGALAGSAGATLPGVFLGGLGGGLAGFGQSVDMTTSRREIPTREVDREPDVFSREWGLDSGVVGMDAPTEFNGNTTTQFHEGGTSAAVTRDENDVPVSATITRPDVPTAANGPGTELEVELAPDGSVVSAVETVISPTGFRIEAAPAPVVEPRPEPPAPPAPRRSTMDSDGSQSNGVGSDFSSSDGDPDGGYSSPF